ncbi:MAG: hypothetical protein DRN17_08355 [Thermoplasmata archaeon]|nr:MAG: hypothetical protein DRN17_08355 [Thermoplasmata archaeon]
MRQFVIKPVNKFPETHSFLRSYFNGLILLHNPI